MAKSKSNLSIRLWSVVGIIAIVALLGFLLVWFNQQSVIKKFAPIESIPPSTEYNLELASNASVKLAYGRLELIYATLTNNPQDEEAALNRAQTYLEIKDTARAILSYQWMNREFPHNPQAWVGLGDIYAMVGRSSDAKIAYQSALKISPDNTDIQAKINELGGN